MNRKVLFVASRRASSLSWDLYFYKKELRKQYDVVTYSPVSASMGYHGM